MSQDTYASAGSETATSSLTAAIWLLAATTRRARIQQIMGSADAGAGAMVDEHIRWVVNRFTVKPTGGAVTPEPLDEDSPAAIITAESVETAAGTPTAGTEMIDQPIHMRSFLHWIPVPGHEIMVPAVAANGVALRLSAPTYTGAVRGVIHHSE